MTPLPLPRINIDQPKYDQSTYLNRCRHFFLLTNPLNLLATKVQLERARRIVQNYRANKPLAKEDECDNIEELWRVKYLYDSAFHPETGEKSILIGRMSAQVPMNTLITGAMLSFYKTTTAVVFWQWFNQTFNAIVNYTNRSGAIPLSKGQLMTAYVLATGGALSTALSMNHFVRNLHPIVGRLVPFFSCTAANCINIPTMRFQELQHGVAMLDERSQELGVHSKRAAAVGIILVLTSRVAMAIPSMTLPPILMTSLEQRGFLKRFPNANAPIQMFFCGLTLIFSTPMACAFFKQLAPINVSSLEPEVQDRIRKMNPNISVVWYNKGL